MFSKYFEGARWSVHVGTEIPVLEFHEFSEGYMNKLLMFKIRPLKPEVMCASGISTSLVLIGSSNQKMVKN